MRNSALKPRKANNENLYYNVMNWKKAPEVLEEKLE